MKRLIVAAVALSFAGTANATDGELSTATLTVHSNVAGISGFVVAALGPALNFTATRFSLAAAGRNSADIASISGIYNGATSWNVAVESKNDFYLLPTSSDLTNVGFRYAIDWEGQHSQEGGSIPKVGTNHMGHYLNPNMPADPNNTDSWTSKTHVDDLTQRVENGAAQMAEYTSTLTAIVHGGQQWAMADYEDSITVTFKN